MRIVVFDYASLYNLVTIISRFNGNIVPFFHFKGFACGGLYIAGSWSSVSVAVMSTCTAIHNQRV